MTGGQDGLSPTEYVAPMFEVAWGPAIGVFAQILETSEDLRLVELCLAGFRHAVRVSGGLDLATPRETLVRSLARFTGLDAGRELRLKDTRCAKALLGLALTDGDALRESWAVVLRCVSQVARLH
ncbi:unnamed protein product, partial [Phaeothamnion confervicola]